MMRTFVAIIGLLHGIMIYGIDFCILNTTRQVLIVKINIAQAQDKEISIAAGERKVIDVGDFLLNWVREYNIYAIVATNDEDGSMQEIPVATLKHNKMGNVECSVFCSAKTNGGKDPKTETLTFYCLPHVPEKSAEFERIKRSPEFVGLK